MALYGVIIPAYEAEAVVGDVVRCAIDAGNAVLGSAAFGGVIVVDDGSTDGTARAAERAGACVIRHAANRGKGAALLTGFREASARAWDAAITIDADGQHDPSSIRDLIAVHRATAADILIGTRTRAGSGMPLPRRLSNRLASAVVSHLARTRVADSQSGYRLIARRVWESVPLVGERYDLESELLVKAGRRGFRILPVPIETRYGSERSHFHPWRDTARLVRLYWRLFPRDAD